MSVSCLFYYLPYKFILTFVNIASCYYSIFTYAKYFAKRHPKVVEDEEAIAIVLRLEEDGDEQAAKTEKVTVRDSTGPRTSLKQKRFTITAIGTDLGSFPDNVAAQLESKVEDEPISVFDYGTRVQPFATNRVVDPTPLSPLPQSPRLQSTSPLRRLRRCSHRALNP